MKMGFDNRVRKLESLRIHRMADYHFILSTNPEELENIISDFQDGENDNSVLTIFELM